MNSINIIFPNQLFEKSLLIDNQNTIYLIEEYLFFSQYSFHKQKILFHRDSMKNYCNYLIEKGLKVIYVDSYEHQSDIRVFLKKTKAKQINIYDPVDNWLEKRILSVCKINNIEIKFHENSLFINKKNELIPFFSPTKKNFTKHLFTKTKEISLMFF